MKSLNVSSWAIGLAAFVAGLILGIALPHPSLLGVYFPQQRALLYPRSASYTQDKLPACLPLVCPNGKIFPSCACTDGACHEIAYFADPCSDQLTVSSPTPTPSPSLSPSPKPSPKPLKASPVK